MIEVQRQRGDGIAVFLQFNSAQVTFMIKQEYFAADMFTVT
jgi:hypothetical protein